jgi:hypothetical protein
MRPSVSLCEVTFRASRDTQDASLARSFGVTLGAHVYTGTPHADAHPDSI